jgi:WD40 repeat protein
MSSKHLPPGVKILHSLSGHVDRIGRIAWSSDGRFLAAASRDQTVRIWDLETAELHHVLRGFGAGVNAVAFDYSSSLLAIASDQAVEVWDTKAGQRQHKLDRGMTWSVAFDPRGKVSPPPIKAQSVNLHTRHDRFDLGRRLGIESERPHQWPTVHKTPGGPVTYLATSSTRFVKLWDAASGHLLETLDSESRIARRGIPKTARSVTFTEAGNMLAAGGDKMTLWNTTTWELLRTIEEQSRLGSSQDVVSICFDPSGNTLAAAGFSSVINLWDVATGRLLRSLEGHSAARVNDFETLRHGV